MDIFNLNYFVSAHPTTPIPQVSQLKKNNNKS